MKRILAGLVVAIAMASAAVAAPLDEVMAANKRGDYATALRLLEPLAEQGNAHAQTKLGAMYDSAIGVPKDYAQAMKW
jgi:TPR repeat protein